MTKKERVERISELKTRLMALAIVPGAWTKGQRDEFTILRNELYSLEGRNK